jgi:phospholipid/cholesterol/gamma-HCH transport system substrate-binding protein
MISPRASIVKFGAFVVVMMMLTAFLFVVFGQTRTGSTTRYSAVFQDVSKLLPGNSVRVAGVRVGTVSDVTLQADNRVTVTFDADDTIRLTSGTRAAVRYLNLVGDRYLELTDAPESTRVLPADSVIPVDRTSPALDLDLLLGGLQPVLEGLNPRDVNALTSSLLQIMQGQEGPLSSLLSETSSFSSTLADNRQVVEQLIDNLKDVLATLSEHGDKFSATIDRLDRLVTELSQERDPIGSAIEALDNGTASIADLLGQARPPLAGAVSQLGRLSANIDPKTVGEALGHAPENFRKMARSGSYGSWIQYFLCDITFRLNDSAGRVMVLPWVRSNSGRCQNP